MARVMPSNYIPPVSGNLQRIVSQILYPVKQTFGMPEDVAVDCPYSRIVRSDTQNDVGIARHGYCVPPYWVLEVPYRTAVTVVFVSPANYLEILTWCVVTLVLRGDSNSNQEYEVLIPLINRQLVGCYS